MMRKPMISYAQNQEDVLLKRIFGEQQQGFYVDVGANHPIENSVTNFFYQRGWNGVNVEPNPSPFALLSKHRKRDKNLPIAISKEEGEMKFYDFSLRGGSVFSTLSQTEAEKRKIAGMDFIERKVPVKTLAWIFEHYCPRHVEFLTIDVEGHEYEVISGMNWDKWQPRVVVVEATLPTTTTMCHQSWEPVLLQNGYLYASFDGLNRYYVRTESDRILLQTPVNVCDRYVPYHHQKQLEKLEKKLKFYQRTTLHLLEPIWHAGAMLSMARELGTHQVFEKISRSLVRTRRSLSKQVRLQKT